MNGSEVDGPDSLGDLLESDRIALEETTDEDLSSVPSQSTVAGDFSEFEVSGVFERIRLIGERCVRVLVNGGRGFHLE